MLSQSGVATSPASKGSELMPSWSEPKSLSLLSQYIVLKSCWRSLILNCLGGKQILLIAFILSYLVTINLMSFFREKEGIYLPSPIVPITCIKTPFSPVVFLGSYNFCNVVFYIICHDVLYQFLCIAHVWWVTIKIYLLTYLLNIKDACVFVDQSLHLSSCDVSVYTLLYYQLSSDMTEFTTS